LRLVCHLGGETESLLLSVIEGILVAPTLGVTTSARDQILTGRPIDAVDFDIEQVRLRLSPRRLAEAIAPLDRMTSPEESSLVVRSIIMDNLRYKITSTEPLDRAIDFLSLARDFVRKGNFRLAAVSLRKSEAALSVPITGITAAYARRVRTVKEQIARTIDELRRSAH